MQFCAFEFVKCVIYFGYTVCWKCKILMCISEIISLMFNLDFACAAKWGKVYFIFIHCSLKIGRLTKVRVAGCGLRATDCGLRVCGLRATDCGLRATDCGLRATDCGLRATNCGLRATDCGLRVAGHRLQAEGMRAAGHRLPAMGHRLRAAGKVRGVG